MKAKTIAILLVLALAVVCLSSCGSKSNRFTVTSVLLNTDSIVSGGKLQIGRGSTLRIIGKYQGSVRTATVDDKTFGDCSLVEATPISEATEIMIVPKGYDIRLLDGVLLTLKDADGNISELEVREGTVLEGDTSKGSAMRFTLSK